MKSKMETQNNTITEDYVSFETAKLLKEKGFNVPVRTFYNPKYRGERVSDGTALINYNADPKDGSVLCSAPTLLMAAEFILEIFNIFIEVKYDLNSNNSTTHRYYYILRYVGSEHAPVPKNISLKDLNIDRFLRYITPTEAMKAAIDTCMDAIMLEKYI